MAAVQALPPETAPSIDSDTPRIACRHQSRLVQVIICDTAHTKSDCDEWDFFASDDKAVYFMRTTGGVALDNGYIFGPGGEGFERVNIACPRSLLEEGVGRIDRAVKKLQLQG